MVQRAFIEVHINMFLCVLAAAAAALLSQERRVFIYNMWLRAAASAPETAFLCACLCICPRGCVSLCSNYLCVTTSVVRKENGKTTKY